MPPKALARNNNSWWPLLRLFQLLHGRGGGDENGNRETLNVSVTGAWLDHMEEPVTPDLGILSMNPALGAEIHL